MDERPLTEQEQTLVEAAYPWAALVAKKYARKARGLDFEGIVALRLVRRAKSYDPARAGLRTWANTVADSACRDALKSSRAICHGGKAKIVSLSSPVPGAEGVDLSRTIEDHHLLVRWRDPVGRRRAVHDDAKKGRSLR